MTNNPADKIIVPLDVPDIESAKTLINKLPDVQFWKVGLELFVADGGTIIDELKQAHKKVFLDLKFHDIPNTVAGACRSATKYGVDLLTVHATAGRMALEQAMEAVKTSAINNQVKPPKVIGITLLTSLNSRELALDLQVPIETTEYALKMALLAEESGLNGVVCSPHEVSPIRTICGDDFLLVCPGVRPEWVQSQDQKRTMTPQEAIKLGADYLVIGRPITAAIDPQAAWEKILESIAQ